MSENYSLQSIQRTFQSITQASEQDILQMGGKAGTLARLIQKSFPVPHGAILFNEPKDLSVFAEVLKWWKSEGKHPVAVRSSASGEDSGDFSYAGQFVTLINISTEEDLVKAIKTCFEAVHRKASKAYASHFDQPDMPMHVLIQKMIQSQFSGVYFSIDPRKADSTWLVEVVEGQGEQLVSGQVTPYRFSEDSLTTTPPQWRPEYLEKIVHWGKEVEKFFGYKVDMEWAIDQEGQFWILQSRPITAHAAPSIKNKILDQEWTRIQNSFPSNTTWDGHTFAEWTGVPTELTFDLWQRTFQEGQAFDLSLRALGYHGIHFQRSGETLLNRIFGKAYLNLKSMEPIYFGHSPYSIRPFPRPHLEFDWKKLTPEVLLRAPLGISRMVKVAWNIQTARHEIARQALEKVTTQNFEKLTAQDLIHQVSRLSFGQKKSQLEKVTTAFTKEYLQGTFLITLVIESTTQGLLALLEKDLGSEKAGESIALLTGSGLQTVASQMHHALLHAGQSDESWHSFIEQYGHRGVGELDLSHPRWIETQKPNHTGKKVERNQSNQQKDLYHSLLNALSPLRRPIFKQEWQELQKLMQIREKIKMALMKPYAQIRWLSLEMGKETGLQSDIFWLTLNEILSLNPNENSGESFADVINTRKRNAHHLKTVDLPMVFSLEELKAVLNQDNTSASPITTGVSLSPGIAHGVVHVVTNPEEEDLETWPDNFILVAEATDPGWTPLFQKARGIIVSRGGVLSHCAIVAREMGLPAVGEVRAASHLFKEGERVWIDGNHGTVRRSH